MKQDDGTISFETLQRQTGLKRCSAIKRVLRNNNVPFVDAGDRVFIIKAMCQKLPANDDDPGFRP